MEGIRYPEQTRSTLVAYHERIINDMLKFNCLGFVKDAKINICIVLVKRMEKDQLSTVSSYIFSHLVVLG